MDDTQTVAPVAFDALAEYTPHEHEEITVLARRWREHMRRVVATVEANRRS
jgi:hypothetical protein